MWSFPIKQNKAPQACHLSMPERQQDPQLLGHANRNNSFLPMAAIKRLELIATRGYLDQNIKGILLQLLMK